jgi:hypothetical protein
VRSIAVSLIIATATATATATAAAPAARAEPPSVAPADRPPATLRSLLLGIRDAKTLRRHSVLPLQEIDLRPEIVRGKDPLDPCELCKPPKPPPRQVDMSFPITKIDRDAWQGVRWLFDLLHPKAGEDRTELVCWDKKLTCEVSNHTRTLAHYYFVRTATGPKLRRIEVEPKPRSMGGI